MFIRSLVPQSLHNGKVLSYLDKADMATRLVSMHKASGTLEECFSDIAINTIHNTIDMTYVADSAAHKLKAKRHYKINTIVSMFENNQIMFSNV